MGKTLLIVDDSKTIAVSVKFFLEKNGYIVKHAENGVLGIKMLNELISNGNIPCMVISDVNMPEMDGIEFLQKIKNDEKTKFIPVLMLTTESSVSRMAQAKKRGATGYLVKPFDPEQLLEMVNKLGK